MDIVEDGDGLQGVKKGRKHMQEHTLKIKSELLCPEDEMTYTYIRQRPLN